MERDLSKSKKIIKLISSAAPYFNQLPWLACYISSKNRFYPKNHILYFQKKVPFEGVNALLLKLVKSQVILFIEFFKLTQARVLFSEEFKEVRKMKDSEEKVVVIKSFAYFSSFKDGVYQDPFFTDLVPLLDTEVKVVHLVDSLVPFKMLKESSSFILPIHAFLRVGDLFKVNWILLKEFVTLPFLKSKKEFEKKGSWERALVSLYHQEVLNPQTFINLCFFFMGKRLGDSLSINSEFFYTYENNCWERLISLGIKKASEKIQISSFQHSVMPEASINFYIGEEEAPLTDFTDNLYITGLYPLSLFQQYSEIDTEKIKILGTTRFNYLFGDLLPSVNYLENDFDFLIALEGVPEAGEVVDRFIDNCIQNDWKPRTLLRLHPAFGIELLSNYLKHNVKDFPFIEVSEERSVINDLYRSKSLVYWGSTCSLEGLMMGKPVIQCDIESELSYDPLGELRYNRYVWKKGEGIKPIFDSIVNQNPEEKLSTSEKGREFVRNYFQKLRPEVLFGPVNKH